MNMAARAVVSPIWRAGAARCGFGPSNAGSTRRAGRGAGSSPAARHLTSILLFVVLLAAGAMPMSVQTAESGPERPLGTSVPPDESAAALPLPAFLAGASLAGLCARRGRALPVVLLAASLSAGCAADLLGLVDATNAARQAGATCGAYEPFAWPEQTYGEQYQLVRDRGLMRSAQAHADYIADTGDYRHQSLDALAEAGGASENIGQMFDSDRPTNDPEEWVSGWLNSPGYCHTLMAPELRYIGVGLARAGDGTWYGVQVFR